MPFTKEDIPVKFYNPAKAGKRSHPRAKNVRELKRLISELPDDLPIDKDCQRLVVMKHLPTQPGHARERFFLHLEESP